MFLQGGWSALMYASWKGHSEIVKYLIEGEASLYIQSLRVRWSSNPYIYIALYSHDQAIVWMIHHLYRMVRMSWCYHHQWTYRDCQVSCRFQRIIRSSIKAELDIKLLIRYLTAQDNMTRPNACFSISTVYDYKFTSKTKAYYYKALFVSFTNIIDFIWYPNSISHLIFELNLDTHVSTKWW